MSVKYEEDKGYIISIDTPKQFAELIEKGQLGLENIELGMFHILLSFQFVDGKAERCKKHGNNYHNKAHGMGSYRPKTEAGVEVAGEGASKAAPEASADPASLENQEPVGAESPQSSA